MKTYALVTLVATAGLVQIATAERIVLSSEHLTVILDGADAGPQLKEIRCVATGATYRFEDDEPVSLFVVPAQAIHDPGLKVEFTARKDFASGGVEGGDDEGHALVHLRHDLVQVDVRYELDQHSPVLRKTITCKANEKPVYIAGVREWLLRPAGLSPAWPKSGALGQPAVVPADHGGYLLTLEWPRAEFTARNGEICLSWRPGYRLAPGESREVAAGSILCFERTHEKDPLEAARRAFFGHVTARVKPKVPFPVKFTTWGPWMRHARADRILEVMNDLAYVGTDLLHFDAGWQWPDHPYSRKLPGLLKADDRTWDREVTQPERLPEGLLPLVKAAKTRGMALSLWFDAAGCVFVREGEEWAARDPKGQAVQKRMWENRWPKAPVQSLAGEYGKRLQEFVLEARARYDLGGVMFDNNNFQPDHAGDHECLANGWDSMDVQLRRIMEIFDACERRHSGIYRFFCYAASWPWALLHATHIHSGDPGVSGVMRKAMETDCPARALAYERRLAWKRHYDNFVPPWGIKGDIAGWSLQQMSPIPANLAHADELISVGEGWTQNMFTCFATTAVRDIRFSFRQMPAFDREVLKQWLAWDRQRSQFVFNCRPLELPEDPNRGIAGFSHVGRGRGVIYLFNCSFDMARAQVRLDEHAGFTAGDAGIPAHIVYPMKARLTGETLSYGQVLEVPIPGKDCVTIEVGLEQLENLAPYADYEKAVASVKRLFDTQFEVSVDDIVKAIGRGPVRVEIGTIKGDRRLASQILETLGAALGRRLSVEECLTVPFDDAACRLIIGTHDGLSGHPEAGRLFREALYNRYLAWDGMLISAPLAARMPGGERPTFCLIAPRPEQLARLAINLSAAVAGKARDTGGNHPDPQWGGRSLTVAVPAGRPVLRFRPLMKMAGAITMLVGLDYVGYEIHAERDGKRTLLWREDIPPFVSLTGEAGWWGDRIISVADFAGQNVTFQFAAGHKDGRIEPPLAQGGFDRVALLGMP